VQGHCSGAPPSSPSTAVSCLGDGGSALPELSVCTIEKASILVHGMLADGSEDDLGCVVVDEAHMIGDSDRGYLLEIMLAKLRAACPDTVQMVCLSATVPNIGDLARWLDADLYVTDFRPIPLSESVVCGGQVHNGRGDRLRTLAFEDDKDREGDPDAVGLLCAEAVAAHKSALVFCATKKATQHCANLIAGSLARSAARARARTAKPPADGSGTGGRGAVVEGSVEGEGQEMLVQQRQEVLEQLRAAPSGMDAMLSKTILQGVAFHHAGLTVEERGIIESAFHRGIISVLTATSTLAAGVNLPADRVIVRSAKVGNAMLDVTRYRQMVGRAGRPGKGLQGESFILASPADYKTSLALLTAPIPPLGSCLARRPLRRSCEPAPGAASPARGLGARQELSEDDQDAAAAVDAAAGLRRALLEVLDSGLGASIADLVSFVCCTFLAQTLAAHGDVVLQVQHLVRHTLGWLEASDLIWRLPAPPPASSPTCAFSPVASLPLRPPSAAAPAPDRPRLDDARPAATHAPRPEAPLVYGGGGGGGGDGDGDGDSVPAAFVAQDSEQYASTQLGQAVVASGLGAEEALIMFQDLMAARQGGVVLDDDLHLIYLVTPITPFPTPWARFFEIYQGLPGRLQSIAARIGVDERFLFRARTRPPPAADAARLPLPPAPMAKGAAASRQGCRAPHGGDAQQQEEVAACRAVQVHARFFAALVLRELLLEARLADVADKYQLPRGLVQQMRASAVSFASMMASFCGKLRWWQLQALGVRFHERLMSQGMCASEVLPLMMVPGIKTWWATSLYDKGVQSLEQLARTDVAAVEEAIRTSTAFARKPAGPGSAASRTAAALLTSSQQANSVKAAHLRHRQAAKLVAQAREIVRKRAQRAPSYGASARVASGAGRPLVDGAAPLPGARGKSDTGLAMAQGRGDGGCDSKGVVDKDTTGKRLEVVDLGNAPPCRAASCDRPAIARPLGKADGRGEEQAVQARLRQLRSRACCAGAGILAREDAWQWRATSRTSARPTSRLPAESWVGLTLRRTRAWPPASHWLRQEV
jgi:hypothetical protein